MENKMIKRHTWSAIFIHWFNAASWIFLLGTGLGLIRNPVLQPLGMWWSDWMWALFGSGENLLLAHEIGGLIWAGVLLLYVIVGWRSVYTFIREIFTFSPVRDLLWLIKKGISMTLGFGALRKLSGILESGGLSREAAEPRIPDQGFYNVGQKLFAIPAVLGGLLITFTGIIMWLSKVYVPPELTVLVRWTMLLHFVTVGLVFGGLLIHIYMASIAAGERPAFISMFTGKVPEDYARHHHRLWIEDLEAKKMTN